MDKLDILSITKNDIQAMITHIEKNLPEEACGLLIGTNGVVKKMLPVTNQARSPVRFFMQPLELLRAFEMIEKLNLDLLGIFHSHPQGPVYPSETDIKEFYYPGVVSVILAPDPSGWSVQGYQIADGKYETIQIHVKT